MKSILTALFLGLAGFTAQAQASSLKCDCKKIAGLWVSVDREARIGTFLHIPASCEGVRIQQIPQQKEIEGLLPDSILCKGGKFRMQYRFPEGYVDDEGTKAVYPLPPEVAIHLRGDVRIQDKDTISFGMDLIDARCVASTGKPCDSAQFSRVPKERLLEE